MTIQPYIDNLSHNNNLEFQCIVLNIIIWGWVFKISYMYVDQSKEGLLWGLNNQYMI